MNIRKIYYSIYRLLNVKYRIKIKNSLEKLDGYFKNNKKEYSTEWLSGMENSLNAETPTEVDELITTFNAFTDEKPEFVKSGNPAGEVNVVCAVKNEMKYIENFFSYYRSIGIDSFFIIDNESTDGTFEYLMEQSDVTLFTSKYKFNGKRKAGWKMNVLYNYCYTGWVLWLDADEFFTYQGMESHDIKWLCKKLEAKKLSTTHSIMLDMYPDYPLMDKNHDDSLFLKEYKFFDYEDSSYEIKNNKIFNGMRGRVMGTNNIRLDKYPLIKCDNYHFPIGNHDVDAHSIGEDKFYSVLRHYKFLPSDMAKYKRITNDKNSGYLCAEDISKYVSDSNNLYSPYYEKSKEFLSSNDINQLSFIDTL